MQYNQYVEHFWRRSAVIRADHCGKEKKIKSLLCNKTALFTHCDGAYFVVVVVLLIFFFFFTTLFSRSKIIHEIR